MSFLLVSDLMNVVTDVGSQKHKSLSDIYSFALKGSSFRVYTLVVGHSRTVNDKQLLESVHIWATATMKTPLLCFLMDIGEREDNMRGDLTGTLHSSTST